MQGVCNICKAFPEVGSAVWCEVMRPPPIPRKGLFDTTTYQKILGVLLLTNVTENLEEYARLCGLALPSPDQTTEHPPNKTTEVIAQTTEIIDQTTETQDLLSTDQTTEQPPNKTTEVIAQTTEIIDQTTETQETVNLANVLVGCLVPIAILIIITISAVVWSTIKRTRGKYETSKDKNINNTNDTNIPLEKYDRTPD